MNRKVVLITLGVALLAVGLPQQTFADGNEILGDPSIVIASGTDFLAAGVGLAAGQPATISLTVPAGSSVVQALLYWQGRDTEPPGSSDTIMLNGSPLTGVLIGQTDGTLTNESYAYRQDITGLVSEGENTLTIAGVDFNYRNDGAMLLVIVDDGSTPLDFFQMYDGLDFAYIRCADECNSTVPKTFTFPCADVGRNASLLVANGDGTEFRQDKTDIWVGGNRSFLCNLASGNDGMEWDTNFIPLFIPACDPGDTSVTVQLFSEETECGDPFDTTPDSLSWVVGALKVEPPPEEPPSACWMTGGGVKFENLTNVWSAEMRINRGGPKDTVGGVVFPSCSSSPGNGGNWNHVSHSEKLHLLGTDIQVVECGNVVGIPPGTESPVCDSNYIEFQGTGLMRGIKGNRFDPYPVTFFGRVEDRNEPGNEQSATSGEDIDRYFLRVVDERGTLVLLVDSDGVDDGAVDPLTITGGNFQIHCSSCDD